MVGGTTCTARFTLRALVECRKEKRSFEVKKKRAPTARKLYVSLDRADAFIEGGAPLVIVSVDKGLGGGSLIGLEHQEPSGKELSGPPAGRHSRLTPRSRFSSVKILRTLLDSMTLDCSVKQFFQQ
jgi:hypothetical protein